MGQGESKTCDIDRYLQNASRHQLLHHYGSVNVDSNSECSTNAPKQFKATDADEKDIDYEDRDNVIDLDEAFDSVKQDNVRRKASKDLSDNSFPSTSTGKILEDYAEYANELINAPYHLRNRYPSNETINSTHKLNKAKDTELSNSDNTHKSTFRGPNPSDEFRIVNPEKEQNGTAHDLDNNKPAKAYLHSRKQRENAETVYVNIPDIVITQPCDLAASNRDFEKNVHTGKTDTLSNFTSETSDTKPHSDIGAQTRKEAADSDSDLSYLKHFEIGTSGSSVISPCLKHYLKQEAELHKERLYCVDSNPESDNNDNGVINKLHKPLNRRGAVVVEVVENSDLNSDISTVERIHIDDRHAIGSKLPHVTSQSVGNHNHSLTKLKGSAQNSSGENSSVNRNRLIVNSTTTKYDNYRNLPATSAKHSDHLRKTARSNRHPHVDSSTVNDTEIYDDVLNPPHYRQTNSSLSSVRSLTDKFEKIVQKSRDNSPARFKEQIQPKKLVHKKDTELKAEREKAPVEEESVYEECSFEIPETVLVTPSLGRTKIYRNKSAQTDSALWPARDIDSQDNCYLSPLSIETSKMVFNRKSKKNDQKRSRHKSDSSTSVVSDSSFQAEKSSGSRWKKSKESKRRMEEMDDDTGVAQQWGSMVTEYEEKYVPDEKSAKTRSKSDEQKMQRLNREEYDNVRQVFNRGMVFPMKRAPPGLSAQEVESESGATDMSAHSWAASSPIRPSTRVHNGYAYDDAYERTIAKQRMNDGSYLGSNKVGLNRDNRMRLSSQSSQYTSDIPVFQSSRDRHLVHADMHRAPVHQRSMDHRSHEFASGAHYNTYGDYRSSGEYNSLPIRRSAYASDSEMFPAHRDSLSARYLAHYERPSSPESVSHNRREMRMHSGYSTTPEIQRKYRLVNSQSPARYSTNNTRERHSRSVTRGNIHAADSSFSPRRSRAVSVPRDIGSFHGHNQLTASPQQHKLRQKSYSQDYLDYDHAPAGSHTARKKSVKFNGKKSNKKTFDEKAKGVVDDIIDEAIELLSPKYGKKNKLKRQMRKSRSRQRDVVHTTNVLNEINEVNNKRYEYDNAVNVNRAYRDNRDLYEMEKRRIQEEKRRIQEERRAIQDFEEDLRAFRQVQQRPLLRPAPLDSSRMSEYRSSIRPVPGSGVTRDGSLPPPRSAYRNYDYELSVGQHAHQSEENKNTLVSQERGHVYSSDSEYSASLQAHYPRAPKPSRYPNVTFGPTRARSEENLLSEQRKSSPMNSLPRRPVQVIKAKNSASLNYDSEPENTKKFNPPTLTRGLVTKILHKLDEDVKRVSKRYPKRSTLNTSQGQTNISMNTWPNVPSTSAMNPHSLYDMSTQWTNLSSPSSYSPRTEPSIHSPLLTPNYPNMEMVSPGQQLGRVDLYLDEPKAAQSTETHARFKLYHGENQPNINISIPNDTQAAESAKLKQLSTINESSDEARYGAFSNEQMIVAGLVDKQRSARPNKVASNQVSKLGKLYGTQPDVSMNKQQSLNFFLFNQMKNENEIPQQVLSDDDEQSIIFDDDNVAPKFESDVEMREYFINHKGTQTKLDTPTPKKSKKKEKTKYIIVQQPIPHEPKQIETTHYITQQREIEKLPPEKHWREVCIQTEPKKEKKHKAKPNVVEVCSVFNPPVITESRQIEKKNFEIPVKMTPPLPAPVSREIPIVYDDELEEEYVQENFENVHIEKRELSDDEETVILETTEVEEKEQRIQMSIFEEYEFSHKRTEDGKTVSIGGPEGKESGIPIFWTPDKYEVVVDKKKKKSTQVKETTQEDERKKRSGPSDQLILQDQSRGPLWSKPQSDTPIAVITENAKFEDSFTREARDNLSALERVLEKELAESKEGPNAQNVNKRTYESPDEQGRLQETSYTSYEKVVPIPKPFDDTDKSFTSQKTVYLSPSTQRKNESLIPMSTFDQSNNVTNKHESFNMHSKSEPPNKRKPLPSSKITYTQLRRDKSHERARVNKPAYMDSYLSLFSAKPYTANKMYGRNEAISNNWKDRVIAAENDPSNELNSHYKELYNSSELDLETGTAKRDVDRFKGVPNPPPLVGNFVGKSHSEQSEPIAKTHYERDADGNMVKVTEWEHKLTKTVEYPNKDTSTKARTMSNALDELPEGGYIDVNLHDNIIQKSDSESSMESEVSHQYQPNAMFSEVTGETQIGRKAFHYDTVESTLNVDDARGLNERRFLYDVKKAQLKPIGRKNKMNGYVYGETMSTQL